MDFRGSLNRIGLLKAVLLLTLLAVIASVVLTWFAMALSGRPMVKVAWILSVAMPLLLVPAIGYRLLDLFLRLDLMEAKVSHLSTTDSLTETLNRHSFFEAAEVCFEAVRKERRPVSTMVMEVDQLARFNREYGRRTGDQLLRVVARTCRGMLRESDLLARFGSAGLVFFLPDTNRVSSTQFAEDLRERLARTTLAHDGLLLRFTVSIGASGSDDQHYPGTVHELIANAETALQFAKVAGRNRVEAIPAPTFSAAASYQVATRGGDSVALSVGI